MAPLLQTDKIIQCKKYVSSFQAACTRTPTAHTHSHSLTHTSLPIGLFLILLGPQGHTLVQHLHAYRGVPASGWQQWPLAHYQTPSLRVIRGWGRNEQVTGPEAPATPRDTHPPHRSPCTGGTITPLLGTSGFGHLYSSFQCEYLWLWSCCASYLDRLDFAYWWENEMEMSRRHFEI